MADAITVWRASDVIASTRTKLIPAMARGAITVEDQAKRLLNRPQPTRTVRGRQYGLDPSAPGDPPKRVSSRLIKSVTHDKPTIEGGDVVVRVGTNVVYGRRLELGYSGTDAKGRNIHQAPRPWLRRALAEKRGEVLTEIAGSS